MTSNSKQDALVVFFPSGKRGRFAKGTLVLEAAQELGVDLDSVCGGRALCARCQVNVTEGELAKLGIVSGADHLSPPGEMEQQFQRDFEVDSSRRLSCHARIEGDLAIDVPVASQVHRQVVRKPHEACDIRIDPVVQAFLVDVAAPELGGPGGALQRLCRALEEQWQLDDLTCGLPVRQRLQQALRDGNWQVTVAVRNDTDIVAVWPGLRERLYGVAVDVGSTTVAVHLCDLRNGDVLASAGEMNPQIRFGEDLMSRVTYVMAHPGSEQELTRVVRECVNALIGEVAATASIDTADIVEVTIVGNSIMQHLMLGISPVELGRAPFTLASDESVDVLASELDIAISPGAYAYVLPCIAGHVGADAAGMLLAEAPFERDDVSLVVDVGTNAELILGNRDRLLAASSPTGPAFEGAEISCGQRAAPGAIERVRIDPETLEPRFKVIGCELWSDDARFGEELPDSGITGICGSGIIEAIAEMFLVGIVRSDGRIDKDLAGRTSRIVTLGKSPAYVLHEGIHEVRIEQKDVRAIQLAKAALYAGAMLLMDHLGVDRVDRIRLAGAFGAQIDPTHAMVLGMIPDNPLTAVSSAGNAAGTGARIALLDRASRPLIEKMVRQVEKIETAIQEQFQEHYVAAMPIPHMSHEFMQLTAEIPLLSERRRPSPQSP